MIADYRLTDNSVGDDTVLNDRLLAKRPRGLDQRVPSIPALVSCRRVIALPTRNG